MKPKQNLNIKKRPKRSYIVARSVHASYQRGFEGSKFYCFAVANIFLANFPSGCKQCPPISVFGGFLAFKNALFMFSQKSQGTNDFTYLKPLHEVYWTVLLFARVFNPISASYTEKEGKLLITACSIMVTKTIERHQKMRPNGLEFKAEVDAD